MTEWLNNNNRQRGPQWGPALKNCLNLGRSGEEFYSDSSRWGSADKNQSVYKDCSLLIWPQLASWRASQAHQSVTFSGMKNADILRLLGVLGKIEGRSRRGNRGRDGWMASPTQWTRVSANSGRWWRIEKPGMLQSMGSQRVGQNWVTEQKSSAEELKDCYLCLLRGNQDLLQSCSFVSRLLLPCLYIHPFPWTASVCIFPVGLREAHGGWGLFPTNKKQGDPERLLCSGAPRVLLISCYR